MSTRSIDQASSSSLSRRCFVQGLAAGGVIAGLGLGSRPSCAANGMAFSPVLGGTDFQLRIGQMKVNYTGKVRTATTVNGSLPGPTLRWREGSTVSLRVFNDLPAGVSHAHHTSIHWHGLVLPANMDGVPGMSFDGIHPGQFYDYRFDVRQAGTYWYHSHSGFQEQAGLYGAIVIEPATSETFSYDRDYVVLLSDWTDLEPGELFERLKKMPDHDNMSKRTVKDFLRDTKRDGLDATLADRRRWGAMRMTPTDLSDVNANTYTYLMNGTTALGNWTGVFSAGEKIRLRFINGSSMTHFDVRIPGLKMTVVAADGLHVEPVDVDEFRIAAAETFDVIVEPMGSDAFCIFAQDMGRTGFVSGTLAAHDGLRAAIPAIDARPILTMTDMGHGGMDHDMAGMDPSSMPGMVMPGDKMPMAAMTRTGNPLVDMRSMATGAKMADPGIGLRDNGRTVLSYAMLKSRFPDPDGREPSRTIELHLTGHMEKFAWSFDGTKFSDAEPLALTYGERVRLVLVNDTMMTHPIHLHGMWSDLEDEQGNFQVRKHTIDMPPGSRRTYRVLADALGRWAYHCHLLYHMESGMMREVRVDT